MSKSIISGYSKITAPKKGALVIFVDSKGNIAQQVENIVDKALIDRIMSVHDFKAKKFSTVETVCDGSQGFDRLILMGVEDIKTFYSDDWLKLGGAARASLGKASHASICLSIYGQEMETQNIIDFAMGLRLRHYKFDKYQTRKDDEKKTKSVKVTLQLENIDAAKAQIEQAENLSDAVILARNLVNEPANILGPEEFAQEALKLKKFGVKVEILNEKDMKKLGMHALLGVSRGSTRKAQLAVMQWIGANPKDQPIAFVGKGVVFDTGGISLKPGAGMEDMKGDMGGAAAVTGLMMALATRKAKANVVGVIGLVENMPDGDAQRPGDIVTSMSGLTIEVINTDAEGRLVLADALWYTKETFKPAFMIDLATLTGAIMVALGSEHAGLFCNQSELADHLCEAGLQTGEKLWPMPLNAAYDKIVDSKFADMRNSCGRMAGAVTAAQFLQRFVGDTPWAHLDIAGTAMDSPKNEYNQSWASGFGVRLLDRLVADFYES